MARRVRRARPNAYADNDPLTVGLGYIPSVQFAQFYRADKQGYYRDAGLAVTMQNQIDAQLVPEIANGQVDIGLSDGTSIVPAVGQGIPVKYAATIYAQFPSVVIARADSGIKSAADLRGKTVGIPGRYGSSWIMLQALLASANLTPDDITIKLYPDFSQATALRESQVDAATGFANNEPVQLALAGIETNVLTVDRTTPLPGQGLTVGAALGSRRRRCRLSSQQRCARWRRSPPIHRWASTTRSQSCRIWQLTAPVSWRSSTPRSTSGTVHTLTRTAWAPSTRTPGPARSIS